MKAGIVLKGQYLNFGKGVLQGGILSGSLANLYLNKFDRQCLSQGINLVRYGDDFVIACSSLIEAERTLGEIITWLQEIYLNIKESKTKIYAPNEEFNFLGYQFIEGKIYAPPPPNYQSGNGKSCDSGFPYRRPRKPLQLISRPPKVCNLTQSTDSITHHPEHYWREPMTTLYITEQGSFLKVQRQQFQVFYQQQLRCKVPANRVSHIVLFGCCNLSHAAVGLALSRQIPVMFLSQRGRYFGRLQAEGNAKVEYLSRQVECSLNPVFTRQQAENIVRAKLHNSRALLLKLNRRRPTQEAEIAIDFLANLMDKLGDAESMDALRGYEGKAASVYFQGLGSLLAEPFTFEKRTKRPPKDPVNSLLSLGYTLLSQNIYSFIQSLGLHTHFGNLHVPRDNHPALVSDLMEEFRAQFVDSFVAYLVNSKIFTLDDFTPPDAQGGVYLHPDSLKKFLKHWEDKLQTEITHPQTGYQVTYRRCLELQVREYMTCLIGKIEAYRPMMWKL
jgi:CRISPR-associated endonuclease Cas1